MHPQRSRYTLIGQHRTKLKLALCISFHFILEISWTCWGSLEPPRDTISAPSRAESRTSCLRVATTCVGDSRALIAGLTSQCYRGRKGKEK